MTPTPRIQRVFKRVMVDKEDMKPAMLAEGYSVISSKNPALVTERKGWRELLEQYLPQDKLVQRHKELLHSEKDDTSLRALDMAYKVRGDYAPEKSVNISVSLKPQEHKAIADDYEAKLLEAISKPPNSPVDASE